MTYSSTLKNKCIFNYLYTLTFAVKVLSPQCGRACGGPASALSFPTNIKQLRLAIDYCALSFTKCKLTLISFAENNCKC